MDTPPPPFEQLVTLIAGDENIDQAIALTQALNAIPELQTWLRERRQHVVRTLHDQGEMSYTEMAPRLGVKPERVSGIARGHSRSAGRGTKKTSGDGAS
ncbi:sigma-70 family RNA polymerase sigma factor [Streptomyces olivaceiscleroticus]|uniref:RNA polymerase sigma-70 region 4 domain-containing protein n=1 Tax=Streptomyces olivaceiscleroticus TaxID=68245 RepID=A0ABN1BMC8_9ACTN